MNAPGQGAAGGVGGFRARLMLAMMLLVSAATGLALYLVERRQSAEAEAGLQREFQAQLGSLRRVRELRGGVIGSAVRALVRKPRIHAALEDDARDLLYPIARDELREVMSPAGAAANPAARAVFYRFLDPAGAVITAAGASDAGALTPAEEARLSSGALPRELESGFLARDAGMPGWTLAEVVVMPILSTGTGEPIGGLALGFLPAPPSAGLRSGVWTGGRLHGLAGSDAELAEVGRALARHEGDASSEGRALPVSAGGAAHAMFFQRLNPGSKRPAAYEVSLFPLEALETRRRQWRAGVLSLGGLLLLGGLGASRYFSGRLSAPVERLAADSEDQRQRRARAEADLALKAEGLRRAERFSSDASHQLKTPVTVLRAGLEELMAREDLPASARDDLGALVHQTYRLSGVVDDLLLLSRADAGRLQLRREAVDLGLLVETGLDDLGAAADGPALSVETAVAPGLRVEGDPGYCAIIVQNLLSNARKYNRPGGRVRVEAGRRDGVVFLRVGNTGRAIADADREAIFERFHRGASGEDVPGHGLGLNLARELARLHGGALALLRSGGDWTEFEVTWPAAGPATAGAGEGAR